MITAILIVLALLWLWCVTLEMRAHGLRRQVDRMCGIVVDDCCGLGTCEGCPHKGKYRRS